MLKTAFVAARDRKRLQQIASILAEFGLDDLLARFGFDLLLPGALRERRRDVSQLDYPERVRRALEELGPTFVKLGQILASRPDILPPHWTEELENLHSRVALVPYDQIKPQIEEDLGGPPEEAFASFDPEPLAAASMAQVYRATLSDGTPVVVKVRRPGLRPLIEADFRILSHFAEIADRTIPELRRYRVLDIVRHLTSAIGEELDFVNEARNTDAAAANMRDDPSIVIPRVHWRFCAERLLVQDYLDGIRPSEEAALETAGLDRARIAARGADAFLRSVFVHGTFHADPHPGNLLCLANDRVGFIDFGMIGRLSNRRRDEVVRLIRAIIDGDGGTVGRVLVDWSDGQPQDMGALEADTEAFVGRHSAPPLDFGRAITDFVAIARQHGLPLPPDLAILIKALLTAEGVVRRLDPSIDLVARAEPIIRNMVLQRSSPDVLLKEARHLLIELRDVSQGLPDTLRAMMRIIRSGKIQAVIDIARLDELGTHIERAATRIAVALVAGAFALGLAPYLVIMGPEIWGIPLFLILGILVVGVGFVWLLLSLRR